MLKCNLFAICTVLTYIFFQEILAKRNQKPEVRKAQREQAIKAAKEARAAAAKVTELYHLHTLYFRNITHAGLGFQMILSIKMITVQIL